MKRLCYAALLLVLVHCGQPADSWKLETSGMEPELAAQLEADYREANWGRLGGRLLVHGLDDDAAYALDQAIQAAPEESRWSYLRAIATGEPADYRLALDQDPTLVAGWIRLGRSLQQRGELVEAQQAMERAHELDDRIGLVHRTLGEIALEAGEFSAASESLQRAIQLDARDGAAWSALSQAMLALGDEANAAAAARRARYAAARQSFPDPIYREFALSLAVSSSKRFDWAQALLNAQQFERAREVLSAIAQQRPGDADVAYLSGVAELGLGNVESASAQFAEALRRDPTHTRAQLDWARLDERAGRFDLARGRIEAALERSPNDPSIALALAQNRRLANDPAGLVQALDRLIEAQPDLPELHALRAEALQQLNGG